MILKEYIQCIIEGVRVNDRIVSPHAGRKLTTGGVAPEYGHVKKVTKGYAYVDFGVSHGSFTPIMIKDLKTVKPGVWKE